MTTPQAWKGWGFSGLLLVAPSEPVNPLQPLQAAMKHLKDLTSRLAQQTSGTLLLLPARTLDRGTCKQD